MRSRLMVWLALCVLVLPLLNACAADQEASVPSLTGRAAAAISAARAAHAASASAQAALDLPSLESQGGQTPKAKAQPLWDRVLNQVRTLNSTAAADRAAVALPSIWRSVYERYREARISRGPGDQQSALPR